MPSHTRIDKGALTIGLPAHATREPKAGDSRRHEAFIRDLPDIVDVARGANPLTLPRCGEIHHLTGNVDGGGKGMGMQNRDRFGLPIGRRNHEWVHPGPFPNAEEGLTDRERLEKLGFDPMEAAAFFWEHTRDRDACIGYMMRAVWGRAGHV